MRLHGLRARLIAAVCATAATLGGAAASASADVASIAMIEVKGSPAEQPSPFDWLSDEPRVTLRNLVDRIHRTAVDPGVDGVFIRLKDTRLNMGQVDELRSAMLAARGAGRRVHVYGEIFGPMDLLLASAADEVLMQAGGMVVFPGLAMEEMYLADTLEWIGVKADLLQIGDYKGADETMTRTAPSREWDQNVSNLLDSMYEHMTGTLQSGRDMDEQSLDKALEAAWMAMGDEAVRVGLIDATIDLPRLTEHLNEAYEGQVAFLEDYAKVDRQRRADMSNPFAIFRMLSERPRHRPSRPTIAMLHIEGPIVDGDSTPGGLFGGASTGSRTIRNALETILEEELIKGVVVRIESPGGSAIASEVIWQGLRRVAEEKPVWASVGSMAASGGYYIAVGSDRIYTNPSSIVGSIGVVGGKLVMGDLYDKLRINVHTRFRGPNAEMLSSVEPWDARQRELARTRITEIYDLFADRVEAGREGIDLTRAGEGRLFLGRDAVDLRMVDQVGGMHTAIADLAGHLELTEFDVMHYPGPKGFDELFKGLFGQAGAPLIAGTHGLGGLDGAAAAVEELLGDSAWPQVRAHLIGLLQLRNEPAVLVLPRALIVR